MPTKLDDGQRVTLKRTLWYRDLILYGIILIQPTAKSCPQAGGI
jgi:putrescine importer